MFRIIRAAQAIIFLSITGLCFAIPIFAAAPIQEFKTYGPFTAEEALKPRIFFWIDIYTKYTSADAVIHDVRYPQVIYEVLKSDKKKEIDKAKKKYIEALKQLAKKKNKTNPKLDAIEKKVQDLLSGIKDEDKYVVEAGRTRVRMQAGLRDQLEQGLFYSGRYLPRMEKVFERAGLPSEIAYLPFVESGFNHEATSHAGASGIWQFMPNTGKIYLRVDNVVDERNDPMRSAQAAAQLMQQNYQILKSWPLAVTAYNHGALGVQRAVQKVSSTSLAEIIKNYDGNNFGFASANYYPCFLAALYVGKNSEKFLGNMKKARQLEFDEFVIPDYIDIRILAQYVGVELGDLKELNPALSAEVYSGKRFVPIGYTLRVPMKVREEFLLRYEKIPQENKHSSENLTTIK